MASEHRSFCKDIYLLTSKFPEDEKYGLVSQLRSVSISIPSNIAEGCSRISNKDFSRFLVIALGPCYEVETQLLLSYDLGFISKTDLENYTETLMSVVKMMSEFNSTLS
ncbi:four helix bundle protein [Tenacibaculum sp. FZY0031]|uniref:four helix bundle protein n=1 Tax=Tenacibaculum sp. FZY0031 TaxID=3116648 RepID=UPI002EC2B3F4|nr:four helix bundle protein [Tenacibaculum sp. FZY0031]